MITDIHDYLSKMEKSSKLWIGVLSRSY